MKGFTGQDPEFYYPPPGLEPLDLAGLLHDAEICHLGLDKAGNGVLQVRLPWISKFHGLPEGGLYSFVLADALRLVATREVRKPRPYHPDPKERDPKKLRLRAIEAGRTESMDWRAFEQMLAYGSGIIYTGWVLESELGASLMAAITAGPRDEDFSFVMSGRVLSCMTPDNAVISIEDLNNLGRAYWDNLYSHKS